MLSLSKMKSAVVFLAAFLLCTLPLSATLKSKSTSKGKAKAVSPVTHASSAAKTHSSSEKPAHTSSVASKSHSRRPGKASAETESSEKVSTVARAGHTGHAGRAGHAGHAARVEAAVASKPKFHGQQSIDQERTLEIQQALIREHYLDGEATGEWDQATRDALTRYQNDNHWQTKIVPDARALIKLGLGPSQQNLLNPESAAIAIQYQSALEKSAAGGSN